MQSYYRGSQPAIPFDPENVDQRNIVRSRPRLPPLDLGQLADFGEALVDNLIVQIQDNATRNSLRTFAFNFWADQQFYNQQFAELVMAFTAWIEVLLMQSPQNVNVVAVIEGEAEPFVSAACANLTELFPDLRSYLPSDAAPQLHEGLNNWRRIVRDVHSAQRSNRSVNSAYGAPAQGRMGGGFNRASAGGTGGYRPGPAVDVSTLRPSWEREMASTNIGTTPRRQGFNATTINQPSRVSDGSPGAMKQSTSTSGYRSLRQAVEANMEPEREVVTEHRTVATDTPRPVPSEKRPFDYVPVGDGSYLTPAYQSEKTPTYSPTTLPEVFNRDDYMLFYIVRPDGTAIETVQKKSDIEKENAKVDYLAHEMDERLRKLYKANLSVGNREIEVPNVRSLRRLVPSKTGTVAALTSDTERLELDRANAPRQLAKPIQATDMGSALFKAGIERDRMDLEDGKDFLEFIVEHVHTDQIYPHALQLLLALGRCQTYEELLAVLDNQNRHEDAMTPELYQHIDRRLTETFNRYLDKQLYLGFDLDDFVEDWASFPTFCTKKFGEKMTEVVAGSAKEVILRALSVLQGEGLTQYLHSLNDAERERMVEPAVFCDRYSITQLPWTMYEMESHWRLEGVLTDQPTGKPLHEALTSLFSRTQTNGVHVRVLLTADGREIYVHRSPVREGDFMITKEPPGFLKEFLTRKAAL